MSGDTARSRSNARNSLNELTIVGQVFAGDSWYLREQCQLEKTVSQKAIYSLVASCSFVRRASLIKNQETISTQLQIHLSYLSRKIHSSTNHSNKTFAMARVTRSMAKNADQGSPKKAGQRKASPKKAASEKASPKKAAASNKPAKQTATKAPNATPKKASPKAVSKGSKKRNVGVSKSRANTRAKSELVPKRLVYRFNGCTVAEIKAALAKRDLDTTGLKQDLFMRLVNDEKRGHDKEGADHIVEDDQHSLPDYESDSPVSQQTAGPDTSKGAQENEQPKLAGPFDCVAFFKGTELPGPDVETDERPFPHNFFIPEAALDTVLDTLIKVAPDHSSNVLQSLGVQNAGYLSWKTRNALQYHMPERYLLARINQHYERGLQKEPAFAEVCQTKWENKLPRNWRTAQFMDVMDAAPAFLKEWSQGLKAGKLSYTHMPTNFAEHANKQWSFGRALRQNPELYDLFKALVAGGKLILPGKRDTAEVTERDLAV